MNKFEKVSYIEYVKAIGGDIDLFDEYNDIKIPKRATTGSAAALKLQDAGSIPSKHCVLRI